jgi:hypothetical protein
LFVYFRKSARDDASRRPTVHATDQQVNRAILNPVEGPVIKIGWFRSPARSPKEVDAIDEHCCLVLPDVGSRKWLADAIGFRDRVGIHQNNFKTGKPSPDTQSLVEIRQPHRYGASRTARADDEYAYRPVHIGAQTQHMLNTHDCLALST